MLQMKKWLYLGVQMSGKRFSSHLQSNIHVYITYTNRWSSTATDTYTRFWNNRAHIVGHLWISLSCMGLTRKSSTLAFDHGPYKSIGFANVKWRWSHTVVFNRNVRRRRDGNWFWMGGYQRQHANSSPVWFSVYFMGARTYASSTKYSIISHGN